ncbi:alcohol dehydrogenase catalytic domain-containing protein [Rossellomorea marisflavi]|uniref:alcohol dehydrogenase catalytic domain-containing protein n=1 Tax=Rossellomorea marisflavi TaxID=189381 RepID=UPI003D2F18DA
MNTRLVLNAPRKLEWISEGDSVLSEDEIRVETHACGISIGAEMPQYLGTDPTDVEPVYPRKVGYESAGRVMEIGRSVTDFKVAIALSLFTVSRHSGSPRPGRRSGFLLT